MRHGLPALGMTVLLLGSSQPADRADTARARADLDSFGDDQLMRGIEYEFDDILEEYEPDDDIDQEVMVSLIMDAFGDQGDDAEESEIGLQDLVDEITELDDGSTLESVVREALASDQAAAGGVDAGLVGNVAVGVDTIPVLVWGETLDPVSVNLSRATRGTFRAVRRAR